MNSDMSLAVEDSTIERLLSRVVRQTRNAVVITDTHGRIVWVNAGFTGIAGYTLSEVIGRTPGEVLQGPQTSRADVLRIRAATTARQAVNFELVNYHKDGTPYWIGMKIEPLIDDDGAAAGFMAIQDDITERRLQRDALEVLNNRFNMATHKAEIGVFERSADNQKIWWNDVLYQIVGRDPGQFEPTIESIRSMLHAADRDRFFDQPTGLDALRDTFRILRPDGSMRYLDRITGARRSANENWVGIVLDVTDRVNAEHRESELQEQLRNVSHQAGMAEIATGVLHNVGNVLNSLGIAHSTMRSHLKSQRADRLELAAALLRDRRGDLAEFLAHDIRGKNLPDYFGALSARIADAVRAMHAELNTVEELLQHLRNIVNAQQSVAQVRTASEPSMLQELIDIALSLNPPESSRILIARTYEELPAVITDRHKFLQILVNLINNARDAVGASDRNPGRIDIRLYRDRNQAVISVEDNGVGIGADTLSRLWEFGFTTKKDGHGFGLHNSANSAHEIGATLDAYSAGLDRGARFDLRLPLTVATVPAAGMSA